MRRISQDEGRLIVFDDIRTKFGTAKRTASFSFCKSNDRSAFSSLMSDVLLCRRRSHMVKDGLRNLEDWEKSLRARAALL